jgi:flagellar biosynthetic protein FliP
MAPTFEAINEKAITPLLAAQEAQAKDPTLKLAFDFQQAWDVTVVELKIFMMGNTRTDDLELFFDLSDVDPPYERLDTPLKIVVPAFIISELKTAFIMGFCIYIPFLLIDLVVSTILMSLGMMMMPPVIVSTPCKILLFVMVDGWQLISKALVSSFVAG